MPGARFHIPGNYLPSFQRTGSAWVKIAGQSLQPSTRLNTGGAVARSENCLERRGPKSVAAWGGG